MISIKNNLSILSAFIIVCLFTGVEQLHSRANDGSFSAYRAHLSFSGLNQPASFLVNQHDNLVGGQSGRDLWPVRTGSTPPFANAIFNTEYSLFKPVVARFPGLISFQPWLHNREFSIHEGFRECKGAFCDVSNGTILPIRLQGRARDHLLVSRPKWHGHPVRQQARSAIKSVSPKAKWAATKASYNVFRSVVIPVGQLPGFSQWQRIAPRILATTTDICSGMSCNTSAGARMARAVVHARRLGPVEAVQFINREVNRAIRYRSDQGDHWSSLAESAARGVGDCEDYAIAKMALLRRVGFRPEQLQFIVLKDTRRHMYHAVLVAHVGQQRYVMDNLSNRVASDRIFRSYVPIASFIGNKNYLHGFVGRRSAVASRGRGGLSSIRLGNRS